jgi:ABC-type transport system involved in cytochrome c biogenesis permease subunit
MLSVLVMMLSFAPVTVAVIVKVAFSPVLRLSVASIGVLPLPQLVPFS